MTKFEYDLYKAYKQYDKKTTENTRGGINFLEALLLVFMVLKLCNVINWSWWWVLSPMWILIALWLILFIIMKIVELFYKLKHK